jgi:monoamine oxidase
MEFDNNPYKDKLQNAFEQIRAPAFSRELNLDGIFEFSGNDPLAAVINAKDGAQIPNRVCIVGAGIAGLTAAYEFLRIAQKFKNPGAISLFEKTARIGGRILTHYFGGSGHAHTELGPMRIPAYHKIVLHYVDELELTLQTFPTVNPTFYFSRIAKTESRVLGEAAGRSLAEAYHTSIADPRLDWFFPGVTPPPIDQMGGHFLKVFGDLFALGSERSLEMLDLFANRPLSSHGQTIEGMTVREAFIQFIEKKAKSIVPGPDPQKIMRCAEFLWESLGRGLGWVWLEHISMAHFLREEKAFGVGPKYTIEGGFNRLGNAFVQQLKADPRVSIRLNQGVTGIEISEKEVKVHITSPWGSQTETFDKVICAAPASAVTKIIFSPQLSCEQYNALSSISYLAASKSAALFRERFWELDAVPQLGGVTHTDLENQQIWYPCDNLVYDDEDREGPQNGAPQVRRDSLHIPSGVRDSKISKQPGALLAAYMWGENARRFASCGNSERDALIIKCLDEIYPGSTKQLTELVHWSWDAQSNPGGGAFAWYQPGQQSRYQESAARAHPQPVTQARVFFAGEHLGIIQGWLQSAMVTALDAVMRACSVRTG